jgi:hypothetical protein
MAVPPTTNEGSKPVPSRAKPVFGSKLIWFSDEEGLGRVRARQHVTTNSRDADALLHDKALLAWLSLSRLIERPLDKDIDSSWHSNEDCTQSDGSESNSLDELSADLDSIRCFDSRLA